MALPLEGFRVVEWAVFQSGPTAGSLLGDLGADVIKIEHPILGDHQRGLTMSAGNFTSLPGNKESAFEHANRNKRDITLDVRSEAGRAILLKLLERSDVFLTNFIESIAKRARLDYETLHECYPKLVYGLVSCYGGRGPDADKRGYDTTGQARSGLMFAMGTRDTDEPTQLQGAPLDQLGGTLLAYAILAALLARERTGVGEKVETSILGAGLHLYAYDVNVCLWTGRPLARHSRSRARNALANFYRCADGKWLMFAQYQSDRYWHDFCNALGLSALENNPNFATHRARSDNYATVIDVVDTVIATRTRNEWVEIFMEKHCRFAWDIVNTVEDVVSDPQVVANEYIVDFEHPTMGRVKTATAPLRFGEQSLPMRPAPEFGEHTEEVLLQLGYHWEDILRFRNDGVI